MKITFKLNGENAAVEASPWKRLIDVLRDDFGLKGTKGGCGREHCDLCLVIINGKTVNSCLIPLFQMENTEVITVEGIGLIKDFPDINLIVKEVFHNKLTYKSGDIIIAVKGLFLEKNIPGEDDIIDALSGIACVGIDYQSIIDGIKRLANMRGRRKRAYIY